MGIKYNMVQQFYIIYWFCQIWWKSVQKKYFLFIKRHARIFRVVLIKVGSYKFRCDFPSFATVQVFGIQFKDSTIEIAYCYTTNTDLELLKMSTIFYWTLLLTEPIPITFEMTLFLWTFKKVIHCRDMAVTCLNRTDLITVKKFDILKLISPSHLFTICTVCSPI